MVIQGILIPFLGTSLGAMCVFFLKDQLSELVEKSLNGFAAGVMVAASIWSLMLPSIDQSFALGILRFLPPVLGFSVGIALLLFLDTSIPHLHRNETEAEGPKVSFPKTTMLLLAVTLHNIPEGMAVGVVFAGALSDSSKVSMASALVLAVGIAIQNFPEGAIISLPLKAEGMSKHKAFVSGVLSGIVEPIAAIITIVASNFMIPILPYLLSFAAGAMFYVVIEELIPEMAHGKHSNIGTIAFSVGFLLMMTLDVMLG